MALRDKNEKLSDELTSIKHQLKERVKELTCLYNLSNLRDHPEFDINDILSKITSLIPPAFQFPKLTVARISFGDLVFKTKNFQESDWKLSSRKKINNELLFIEVFYLKNKEFLQEEKDLLEEITDSLKIIIEKKLLEKGVQNLNNLYRKILDGVKSGVWVSNKEDYIIYCNKTMERITHVPRKDIVGNNIYDDFSESTTKNFIKYYNEAKKNLKPVFYENIFVFTPGKRQSVQSGWLIPLEENNEFSHMICTVNDLTEIENTKEKLKDRESRYRAIVSSNSFGVAIVDMEGHTIETNEYLNNMFGYTAKEFKKIHFKEFTYPEDVDIDLNLFHELIHGEREYYHIEKRYIHKSGDIVWGDLTATLVRDSEGNPKYVISLVQDITEKKKAEAKLKKSKQELKELTNELEKKVKERTRELRQSENKYKQAFQRVDFYKNLITHDMNNILQNIQSSVELNSIYLENPAKKDELKEINGILKEQITRADRLIKNARKLSKIEEGKIRLFNINICEELKTCIEFIEKSYQSREIYFKLNCEYENLTIKGNELIQDLFENLIMNAIKHNDSTQIEITINALLEKKKNQIRLEFIDNGIGISDQKKKNIFLSNSRKTSSSGGMGLGLSLVKKILHIYKGNIWVENRVMGDYTKGSKFIIEFPTID